MDSGLRVTLPCGQVKLSNGMAAGAPPGAMVVTDGGSLEKNPHSHFQAGTPAAWLPRRFNITWLS